MACSVNNCFLVNAPAGSGKTTKIKGMVKDKLAAPGQAQTTGS